MASAPPTITATYRARASLEEQVVNLHRRATETRQHARQQLVRSCMRRQPETSDELWETLKSLGYDELHIMEAKAVPSEAS